MRRLTTLPPRTQVVLTVLVPGVCLTVAALLLRSHLTGLRQVTQDLKQTQRSIAQKQKRIAQAETAGRGRPLALAVALPDEQEPIVFLKQLAALTNDSGVALTAVRALAPTSRPGGSGAATATAPGAAPDPGSAPTAPSQARGPGQRPVLPEVVKELKDQVTVEGSFAGLLALLVRLENYDRILSVSQCKIHSTNSRSSAELRAIFTLSRFVAMPNPSQTAATALPAR